MKPMSNDELLKEIVLLKKELRETQNELAIFFENAHAESQKNISVLENTIVDNEIQLAELQNKVGE